MRNQWLVLAGFIFVCLAAGFGASFATAPAIIEWYPTLNKPWWNPPNWAFGPAWTILYILMAIAAWLVWKQPKDTKGALILFFSQLALNFAWSFLFFGARSPWLGLIGVAFMLAAVAITTVVFWRITKPAGMLFIPYLAWTAFAAFLNLTIWRMN
ncbi:MAG: TspO/MBR family protein [Aestuariivirga sp.]